MVVAEPAVLSLCEDLDAGCWTALGGVELLE